MSTSRKAIDLMRQTRPAAQRHQRPEDQPGKPGESEDAAAGSARRRSTRRSRSSRRKRGGTRSTEERTGGSNRQRCRNRPAAVRDEQQANNQKMAAMSQELARQREHRSALKSRQNVLSDLQNKREGVSQVVRRDSQSARCGGRGFGYVAGWSPTRQHGSGERRGDRSGAGRSAERADRVRFRGPAGGCARSWQKLAGRVTVLARRSHARLSECQRAGTATKPDAAAHRSGAMCGARIALLVHQLLGTHVYRRNAGRRPGSGASSAPRDYRFVTRAGEVVEAGAALRR